MAKLNVRGVVSAMFDQNAYIVWRDGETAAILVDPGFDADLLWPALQTHGLTPAAIVNTHGHVDHIAGNAAVRARLPEIPILIGAGDAAMLTDADLNLSGPFGVPITSPPATRLLHEGDVLDLPGGPWTVREIPGHSPGHVVLIGDGGDGGPPVVLGGDVLFAGGIGRTDFPGGSMALLLAGIRAKLFDLPDATVVYPGHGPATTVGRERRTNPFLS